MLFLWNLWIYYLGWSGHPVCGKRYHFIIKADGSSIGGYHKPCMCCGDILHLSESKWVTSCYPSSFFYYKKSISWNLCLDDLKTIYAMIFLAFSFLVEQKEYIYNAYALFASWFFSMPNAVMDFVRCQYYLFYINAYY